MRAVGPGGLAGWVIVALLTSTLARGQVVLGSISGTVTDATGAALPGVTITVTSAALQVPQLARISESDGAYRVSDLPPGGYRATFELAGFATVIRAFPDPRVLRLGLSYEF